MFTAASFRSCSAGHLDKRFRGQVHRLLAFTRPAITVSPAPFSAAPLGDRDARTANLEGALGHQHQSWRLATVSATDVRCCSYLSAAAAATDVCCCSHHCRTHANGLHTQLHCQICSHTHCMHTDCRTHCRHSPHRHRVTYTHVATRAYSHMHTRTLT